MHAHQVCAPAAAAAARLFEAAEADLDAVQRALEADRQQGCVVRLRGLPYSASAEDVARFFEGVALSAEPDAVVFVLSPSDGRRTGEAFVQLASQADLGTAMNRHKECMGHRYIEVFHSSRLERLQELQQQQQQQQAASAQQLRYQRPLAQPHRCGGACRAGLCIAVPASAAAVPDHAHAWGVLARSAPQMQVAGGGGRRRPAPAAQRCRVAPAGGRHDAAARRQRRGSPAAAASCGQQQYGEHHPAVQHAWWHAAAVDSSKQRGRSIAAGRGHRHWHGQPQQRHAWHATHVGPRVCLALPHDGPWRGRSVHAPAGGCMPGCVPTRTLAPTRCLPLPRTSHTLLHAAACRACGHLADRRG